MPDVTVPSILVTLLTEIARWAKKHGLPTYEATWPVNVLKEIAQATFDAGVEFVSIYGLSNENWERTGKPK